MNTPLKWRFCFLHTIRPTNKSSFVFDSLLLVQASQFLSLALTPNKGDGVIVIGTR